MKLIRKAGAPVLTNKQGLDIPNAVILPIRFLLDYKQKTMHIMYGLFSDDTALSNGYAPIERGEFSFDDTHYLSEYTDPNGVVYQFDGTNYLYKLGSTATPEPTPGDVIALSQADIDALTKTYNGKNSYDVVLQTLVVTSSQVEPVVQASKDWILAQLDWDGVPFGNNWEIANAT